MTDLLPIRRALLSVSDKSGLLPLAQALVAHGVELISTGGTARALRGAGLTVQDVAHITSFPEMLDGRVKTLHPAVHGAILARRDCDEHMEAIAARGIAPIDLVVVNLYPFEAALERGAARAEMIEEIDIGGPALIRSAAKNHDGVAALADPDDYAALIAELEAHDGHTSLALRRRMAARAFAATAAYDAVVAGWFAHADQGVALPELLTIAARRAEPRLRYGENPHQAAALYVPVGPHARGVGQAEQVQGKALSYNNLADADAAFELAAELAGQGGDVPPAIIIVKHANPCGVATGTSLADAHARALRCDPVSAYGGIVAATRALDEPAARAILAVFTEVVIAPAADQAARTLFAGKPNLRLLLTGGFPDPHRPGLKLHVIAGGLLVQTRDDSPEPTLTIVTKRQPTDAERADMAFAWMIAKHVKSNAVVYAKDGQTAGIGAGQPNRRDSARLAAAKAREASETAHLPQPLTIGSAVASDAFFPFADGLLAAAEAGATAVIQPGGSIRDVEVIAAADAHGLTMAFTGVRHFRH